jgi:ssDNA-binding Zn-finger/Zn-ribbon topoisomerase 1
VQVSDNHLKAREYIKNLDSLTYEQLVDAMTYKWFRLNTLYHIKNKSGKKVLFTPNEEQEAFYCDQHGRDIILKVRQLGFTTFKMISDLDDCLFIENFSAGCICHNMDSAKDIFRNKIKFAYSNITEDQKQLIAEIGYTLPEPTSDKGNAYVFSNGSSIKVGTSYRGDTLQSLHVSEFGKICKKYPEKANEIVTGAFEAVPADGGVITLESTAEGKEGYFFKYCQDAKKLKDLNKKLSVLDFRFHFFSWYKRDEYAIDGDIAPKLEKYFNELEFKHGIRLNDRQKAWYSAKWKALGDDMRREYPSTPKEAFEQSIEGAYYAQQFADIYKDGRILNISKYKNEGDVKVQSDIGVGDSTALWFYRNTANEIHLLHYHENSGEGLGYYLKYIEEIATKNKWRISQRYGPHDMNNREFGSNGKTRKELAAEGIEYMGKTYRARFEIVPKLGVDDGIQLVRGILPKCVFDESCEEGIKALESYRKEWNDKLGCWRDKPLHDWASDGSDSFRYLAVTESRRVNISHSQHMIV